MKKITDLLIRIIIYLAIAYILTNAGSKVTALEVITLFGIFITVVGVDLLGFYKKNVQENHIRAKVISNSCTLIMLIWVSYLNTNFLGKNISIVIVSLVLLAIISTFDGIKYKKIIIDNRK